MKIKTARESVLAGGCAAAFALAGACQTSQEPVDPQVMAARAAENVGAIFQSAAHAADGNRNLGRTGSRLADGLGVVVTVGNKAALDPTKGMSTPGAMPALLSPRSALGSVLRSVPGVRSVARPLASDSMFGPSPLPGALAATAGPSELASDLDETGENLGRLLKERIFTAANLESKTDAEAIYLLRPDPTCRDLDGNELDAKCADYFTKVEVRVRLTRAGGGARFELLVGSERARPVALDISDTELAVDLYLGGIKATSAILAKALGSKDETPAVLSGALRYALTREAEHRAALSMAITEAVAVANDSASADHLSFKSAATNPLFKLTADGDAGTVSGRIGLSTTEVSAPWQPDGNENTGARMHLVLGGLTGQLTVSESSDSVKLTDVGLGSGPTYLEVRGQRILQVDVNERDGRKYDLAIDFDDQGTPRLALTPRFDLALAWKLAAVASDFKQSPPTHLLDERYQVTLDPAAGLGPVFRPIEDMVSMGSDDGGVQIVSGKLTISSSKVNTPVTVEAGQCLSSATPAPGQHPVLGAFKAGPCP